MTDETLVVPDATLDNRFSSSPLVTNAPGIRFYAGAPLVTPEGHRIGALCVADQKPREKLSAKQNDRLKDLAAIVVEQMDLRRVELARAALRGFHRDREGFRVGRTA